MNRLTTAFVAMLFVMSAHAGDLAKGTAVRIEGSGIEGGWHYGKITITGEGCTMVTLQKPTKDGYTMIALIGVATLQLQHAGTWADVSLEELKSHEPKKCLEEGSD